MNCLCCVWLWVIWLVGFGSLTVQEDSVSHLDVVRPDCILVILVHLLPGLLIPVLVPGLLDILPLWVGLDV